MEEDSNADNMNLFYIHEESYYLLKSYVIHFTKGFFAGMRQN